MVSFLLLTVATLQGVHAWGSLGHATIAYIAQNYVTEEVATWSVESPALKVLCQHSLASYRN